MKLEMKIMETKFPNPKIVGKDRCIQQREIELLREDNEFGRPIRLVSMDTVREGIRETLSPPLIRSIHSTTDQLS
ncbi:hypothetical protein TNIN_252081 [Trichonephila inaurata madagascariensis]|uniref:Uncharacterized protein n=1 Tax=Trichonephila inaurata madagascariensis TaxID=2747483 RepID=A0A8X6WYU0_9ARAC|nr:hypothetical protein TNIN_252081 [Trichonephila inaurata madagascariensis]